MKRSMLLASFAALMAFAVPRTEAASDFLLEIDGVKGESPDSKHPGTIEIESFSWGVSNVGGITGGGGVGKPTFKEFTITKKTDKSTPMLFLSCAQGQRLRSATLFVRKAGGDQVDYYVIKLTDILVSSLQQAGTTSSSDSRPMESLSLNFTKIEFTYLAGDGSVVPAGWDIAKNAPP